MLLHDTLSTAFHGITANPSRSLLTMLGIIIGVGSVILMTSLGGSVQQLIVGQVSSLGAKSMVVFPGTEEGSRAGRPAVDSLTFDDRDALSQLTTIAHVSPVIFVNGKVQNGSEEATPQVMGITADFFVNQNIEIDRGRLIETSDDEGARFVADIAPDTAKDLFGDQDPMGRRIQIKDQSFIIVGLLQPLGSQFFQNSDKRVYIPFSTAKILTGQTYVNYFTLQATDDIDIAAADMQSLLRQRHHIVNPKNDPAKDDFVVRSAAQALEILGTVSVSLTLFLSAIAGISLVVGGIGIMNIMLVVVTERTREIGLRKAVGARSRDILLQFLAEAIMLTMIGGLLGIIAGVGVSFIGALIAHRFLSSYTFILSLPALFLAVGVAGGVGVVFGIYPARQAAALSPIEALRYE